MGIDSLHFTPIPACCRSMACRWFARDLEPAHHYHQGNHDESQPDEYLETAHEGEKRALL
jgi:hypothetical protein